jgi:hypothetical protein
MPQEGVMSIEQVSPPPQPDGELSIHNPILTRSHEPPRAGHHSWLMIVPLVVVIVAGAAFWVYANGHPSGPLVNHAVAQASDKPAWQ